eukprot:gene26811-35501_t
MSELVASENAPASSLEQTEQIQPSLQTQKPPERGLPKSKSEKDPEKSNSVADRIALFKSKSVKLKIGTDAEEDGASPPVQRRQAIPSPLEKVNISQRISMFKKEMENLSPANNNPQPKAVVLDNQLSISERISKLRQEQLSNSQTTTLNRAVPVIDGYVSDRVAMLMKEAEKNSPGPHMKSATRLASAGDKPPSLSKPEIEITASSERESKNKLQQLLDRLTAKDPTLTVLEFNNSNLLAVKDENFELFAAVLKDNPYIMDIELCNVMMKDRHCVALMEALKTCPNLVILNIETNMLTGMGIEAVVAMAERHPTLKELRIDNQRMAVGIEAERAIANCLSQNINIIRLSYTFRETFVFTYVNKYLQRNLDHIRQLRVGKSISTEPTPLPYPHIQLESDAAFLSPTMREKIAGTIFEEKVGDEMLSVTERISILRQDTRIAGVQTNSPPHWARSREKEDSTATVSSSSSNASPANVVLNMDREQTEELQEDVLQESLEKASLESSSRDQQQEGDVDIEEEELESVSLSRVDEGAAAAGAGAEEETVSLPSISLPVPASVSVSDLLQLPVDDDDEGAMTRSAAVTEVDDSLPPQSS